MAKFHQYRTPNHWQAFQAIISVSFLLYYPLRCDGNGPGSLALLGSPPPMTTILPNDQSQWRRKATERNQTNKKQVNKRTERKKRNYEGQSMLTKNKLHVLLYMLPFLCSSTTASTRHGFFSWVKFVPPSPWQLQYFAAIIQRENRINNTANWKQRDCQRKDLRPTSGSISSNSSCKRQGISRLVIVPLPDPRNTSPATPKPTGEGLLFRWRIDDPVEGQIWRCLFRNPFPVMLTCERLFLKPWFRSLFYSLDE